MQQCKRMGPGEMAEGKVWEGYSRSWLSRYSADSGRRLSMVRNQLESLHALSSGQLQVPSSTQVKKIRGIHGIKK